MPNIFSPITFAVVAKFQPRDLEHLELLEVTGSPKDFTAETEQRVGKPALSTTRAPLPGPLHRPCTACEFLMRSHLILTVAQRGRYYYAHF